MPIEGLAWSKSRNPETQVGFGTAAPGAASEPRPRAAATGVPELSNFEERKALEQELGSKAVPPPSAGALGSSLMGRWSG